MNLVTRGAAAAFALAGILLTAGCGGMALAPVQSQPSAPAAGTVTANRDKGLTASWVALPGGKEEVLCIERTRDGIPTSRETNGVSISCDWSGKRPVASSELGSK